MTDPEVRVDPLSGATVVVAAGRQARPNLPTDGCPFCPGGIEAPPGDTYDVHHFPNRWPPLPDERAEVLLFSPEHERSLGDLGDEQVRTVVDLWADRTTALGGRDDVAYVLLFENRGPSVGATIQHPHGQLYAFDGVPDAARRELERATCAVCESDDAPREVTRVDGWSAVVPFAPTWPFELRIAPDEHVPDVPTLDDAQRDAFAHVLGDALGRLDRLFDDDHEAEPMPYMLWIHQRPTDGGEWPTAHLHVHVAPILRGRGNQRFVAAGELGSGVWFDPIVPEEAAARLRDVAR